ncbi:MAG: hypothetical protein LBM92_08245 [Opitutaceae bacterium]|jgi:uncharacterized protein involved in outer membrane biogenesis|nr:hypothetical protein [Opitutaceae bacterium]
MSENKSAGTAAKNATPEKKKGKWPKRIALALLVCAALIVIVWVFFLTPIVTSALHKRTGYDIALKGLSVNPFTARVSIDSFVINNPGPDYAAPEFVDLPAFKIDAALFSLLGSRMVLEDGDLNLSYVALVKPAAKNGVSNAQLFLDRLTGVSAPPAKDGKTVEPKPGEAKPVEFLIKRLHIRIGKVIMIDEAKNTRKELAINFEHTYENVTDAKQFITADLARSLLGVGSQLSELVPGKAGKTLDDAFKKGVDFLTPSADGSDAGAKVVKGLLDKLDSKKKE